MEKYKDKYETMIDIEIEYVINDLIEKIVTIEPKQLNKYIVKIIKDEN